MPNDFVNLGGSNHAQSGPRSADSSITAGRGVLRFGEPGRAWSGLPRQPAVNVGGVAVQEILREGITSDGVRVALHLAPPEFVAPARAQFLVERGLAKLVLPPESPS
jgi:hypothetical protein